jgi:group II intron reverse transcriptase/maturase
MAKANNAHDKTQELQNKLYRAAKRSPNRRFHALYDRIYRRDLLERAWSEVRANQGAPGVDGVTIQDIEEQGVEVFLDDLAQQLQDGNYRPLPVRRVTIPKRNGGGQRHLGVPVVRDRVVQAATKAVLEPIFEADFLDCSYGFRPGRSAHQALDAVQKEVNKGRVWVVDADIANCFDSIGREVLLDALRERISDRRVLRLIVGWLKAGVLADRVLLHPESGTPQGGVLSPLLCNVVLHRLDRQWQAKCRRLGVMVRYADDLVILCPTEERAEAALAALETILASLGLELAQAKTRLVDLREHGQGFDFLGFHHRRMQSRRGSYFCYRWPSRAAVRSARANIKARTERRRVPLSVDHVVEDLNRFLRGWRNYYRYGNSSKVFHQLDYLVIERLARFISKKHGHAGRDFGMWVLVDRGTNRDGFGLVRLYGNVRYGDANAVR